MSDHRAERRRAARAEARRPRVDVETGTMATPLGDHFRTPERVADLPPKVPGRHRWILSTAYNVTDDEAARAHAGASSVLMGPERLISFGIGCWDCERSYGAIMALPCPAGALEPS